MHPAARIDAVDLADVDPCLAPEREHVGARPARCRQRLELVEDRRQDHRRDPGEDGGEHGHGGGAGNPPTAREATDEGDQKRGPGGRDRDRDRGRAAEVPDPGAERLRGDPDVDRTLVRRDPERQRRDGGQHGDPRPGERGAAQRASGEPVEPAPQHRRPTERDRDQDDVLDGEPAGQQPQLTVAVAGARARSRRR